MNLYEKKIHEARKNFLELNLNQEKELLRIYRELANQLSSEISNCRTSSQNDYLKKLNEIVKMNINQLKSQLGAMIKANIETSSQIALTIENFYYQSITDNIVLSTMFTNMVLDTSRKTISKLISGKYYEDEKTLEQRIWNITRKNAQDIDTLIKVNISRGANAKTLAKEVNSYVNPSKRSEAKVIISGMSSKVSYQAQRLARTSISHAFAETTIENAKNNPFNKGIKWNLSASHGIRMNGRSDICDDYAGKVFKPDEVPIQHPNCLCYFTEENKDIDIAIKELKEWENGKINFHLDNWYKLSSDKEEYQRYRQVLKDIAPNTFAKFNELKYNNNSDWVSLENKFNIVNSYKVDFGEVSPKKILELDELAFNAKRNNQISKYKKQGNFAVLQYNDKIKFASSRIAYDIDEEYKKYKGNKEDLILFKEIGRKFKTSNIGDIVDGKENTIPRYFDTEAKFFEYLNDCILYNEIKSIYMLSEKAMCESCKNVAKQFIEKHPNIKVNVVSGNTFDGWKGRK